MSMLLLLPAAAGAQEGGGVAAPSPLRVTSVRCVSNAETTCPARRVAAVGATMRMRGNALHQGRAVLFRGRRGPADDVSSPVRHGGRRHLEARVPLGARSGRVD